jgi:hypothetical protein
VIGDVAVKSSSDTTSPLSSTWASRTSMAPPRGSGRISLGRRPMCCSIDTALMSASIRLIRR